MLYNKWMKIRTQKDNKEEKSIYVKKDLKKEKR